MKPSAGQGLPDVEKLVVRVRRALASRARSLIPLPAPARAERRSDHAGLSHEDPGSDQVLAASIEWLARAQDCSLSADGGVAHNYSLIHGWASSYPETTGYIIPTFLEYAKRSGRTDLRARARRMADWLVDIQLPCGGFQGGKIDSIPVVPVTFNTGQILLGLAAAEVEFGEYRTSHAPRRRLAREHARRGRRLAQSSNSVRDCGGKGLRNARRLGIV